MSAKILTIWFLGALTLIFSMFLAPHAGQAGPSNSMVVVKQLDGVRVHSMLLAPSWNAAHIFETDKSLIIMDAMGTLPDARKLRSYAESLGKPIKRLILSHAHDHHVLGAAAFQDVPIYGLPSTIAEIKKTGDQMIQEIKAESGDAGVPDTATVPQHEIQPGQERIDGVLFNWMNVNLGMDLLFAELPEAGVLVTHHMLYNYMHAFVPPNLDGWKAGLKKFQGMGHEWILAAHGIPGGPEVYENQLQYLETVRKVVAEASDPATAKAALVSAYPAYPVDILLDYSLPALFTK